MKKWYVESERSGSVFCSVGPWSIPYKTTNVRCPDGRRRTVWHNGQQPDTWLSQPGKITYRGKTVTGFVSYHSGYDGQPEALTFTPYAYGKNGHLFDVA